MEREASTAPSFTSLPGDRKRGFAALTGLLKRKPHGSKGEGKVMHGAKNPRPSPFADADVDVISSPFAPPDNEAMSDSVPYPPSAATRSSTSRVGDASSSVGSDGIRSSTSSMLRHDPRHSIGSSKASLSKGTRRPGRKGSSRDQASHASQIQMLDPIAQEYNLDTDLEHMEGIVNLTAANPPFAHGASASSSGSGSDARLVAGLAGKVDPALLTQSETSSSTGSGVGFDIGRAVIAPANNIPSSPFTRQNPFSRSLDSDGPVSENSPPSPHTRLNKPSFISLSNQPRRPSQLRNASGMPSDENRDEETDRIPLEVNSGEATVFRDPFNLGAISQTRRGSGPTTSLAPHESEGNTSLPTTPGGTDGGMLTPGQVTPQLSNASQPIDLDTSGAVWTAPESWGVEGDAVQTGASSSEEDNGIGLEANKDEDDFGDRQITPRGSGPPPFGAKAIKRQRSRTGTGTRTSSARQGNVVRSVFQSRPGTGGSAYLSTAPVSV